MDQVGHKPCTGRWSIRMAGRFCIQFGNESGETRKVIHFLGHFAPTPVSGNCYTAGALMS